MNVELEERYKKIEQMTSVQIAYFSGLLDGEGCVRIGKFKNSSGKLRYRAFMVIAMTDKRPINWLIKTVGGKLYIDKKLRNGASKMCFSWTVHAEEGASILKLALPYLLVKREQAINFINFSKTLGSNGFVENCRGVPQYILKRRKILFYRSRYLNRKGRVK